MSKPRGSQRLLVVDDDENMRTMLVCTLERDGYHVDTAEDGVEGLRLLRAIKYDLLISDNQMPRLTGLEMIKHLHSERIQLPIIMATTSLKPEDLAGVEFPAVKLLIKPYTLVELLTLVRNELTTAGADQK